MGGSNDVMKDMKRTENLYGRVLFDVGIRNHDLSVMYFS